MEPPKVVFGGAPDVGKTTILSKFHGKELDDDVETITTQVSVDGTQHTLNVCDTGGQERYRNLTAGYYLDAVAMIIVFDLTRKDTFEPEGYIGDGKEFARSNLKLFLVGNKVDLASERQVEQREIDSIMKKHPELQYFETSATEGTGVQQLFQAVAKGVAPEPTAHDTPKVSTSATQTKNTGGGGGSGKKKGSCALV